MSKQTQQNLVIPDYLNLNKEQIEKLYQLYHLVQDIWEKNADFLSVPCLCRYLRARDYNVEKAHSMLLDTIKWRNEFKPNQIGPDNEAVKHGRKGKGAYVIGKSKLGQPICYIIPNSEYENTKKIPNAGVQWLAYIMETTIKRMEEGVEKMVLIVDVRNFGTRAASSAGKEEIMGCIQMLQNHYPERLGQLFVCDTPWWFNVLWWFVYPFLSAETARKIHFVNGDLEYKQKELGKHIDLDQLSTEFGGRLKITERMKEYWDIIIVDKQGNVIDPEEKKLEHK